MSQPPSNDTVAVACVVESSLTVSQIWTIALSEYISQIMRRINEMYPNIKMRLAFVTYGTADTRPSPLLAKRFFADISTVIKTIKDDYTSFGLGQTNEGAGRGMAALEGLVSAVELFDQLQACLTPNGGRILSSHIIHVAACAADHAEHPLWNDSPLLDNVTWETLPAEFKKRNINLSEISLRGPNLFAEVQSASCAVQQPWFSVRQTHTVVLAGCFVNAKAPAKRPAETSNPADAKRIKIQTPEISPAKGPSPPSTTTVNQTPPTPANTSAVINAPVNRVVAPTPAQIPPHIKASDIGLHRAKLAAKLKEIDANIAAAAVSGKTDALNALQKEKTGIRIAYDTMDRAFAVAQQRDLQIQKKLAESQQSQSSTQSPSAPLPNTAVQAPLPQFGSQPENNNFNNSRQMPPQAGNNGNNVNPQQQPGGRQFPPSVAGQMQKMVEQSQRNPSMISLQMQQAQLQMQQQQQQQQKIQMQQFQQAQQAQQQQAAANVHAQAGPSTVVPKPNPPPVVWSGFFSWPINHNESGPKEFRIHVQAGAHGICHEDTWPSVFSIVPTKEPQVSLAELHPWVRGHGGIILQFAPSPLAVDKANSRIFMMLASLLTKQNVYGTAAWTFPNGVQKKGLLIVPVPSPALLVGCIFPVNGLPELPRHAAPSDPNRDAFLIAQKRQLQLQAQHLQQQNLQNQQQQQQQNFAMNQQQQQMSGAGNTGVTDKILHSFLSSGGGGEPQQQQQQHNFPS